MPPSKARRSDADMSLIAVAETALDLLYDQYFAATAIDQLLLKPQIEQAAHGVLKARLLLLAPGTIAATADVKEAKRIKESIDQAASTQDTVIAAARLIALLARFG